MAYDLEEQEQLDALKAWWKKYGNLITWVLVIALGGYAGWMYWKNHQASQAMQAAQLYDELQRAAAAKDNPKVQRAAGDMQSKFGNTTYAQMGALVAAKAGIDANDEKAAKSQLEWVIQHGDSSEYKAVAKIRLAGILLDEKAYDEALKQLSGDFPSAFAGAVADRKGDILLAQNKIAEAKAAYQLAIEKMDKDSTGRQLVQMKLDALGGAPAKAAA